MKRDWDKAFAPTPELFHRRMADALRAIEASGQTTTRRYRASTFLVAALITLALAGGIALAAAGGVFGAIADLYGDDARGQQYRQLEELADATSQRATTADGEVTVELTQSYLDGNSVYVGLRYADDSFGATAVDWGCALDEALRERIKREGTDMSGLYPEFTGAMSEEFTQAYARLAAREFTGDDYGCLRREVRYISDHARLTLDGVEYDMGIYSDAQLEHEEGYTLDSRKFSYDPEDGAEALPAAREASFALRVKRSICYVLKDASGMYMLYDHVGEVEQLEFPICASVDALRTGSAHAALDGATVDIQASVSAASATVTFTVRTDAGCRPPLHSEAELEAARASGQAVLWDFVMVIDGHEYSSIEDMCGSQAQPDGSHIDEYRCIFPGVSAGSDSIVLRPVYLDGAFGPDIVVALS